MTGVNDEGFHSRFRGIVWPGRRELTTRCAIPPAIAETSGTTYREPVDLHELPAGPGGDLQRPAEHTRLRRQCDHGLPLRGRGVQVDAADVRRSEVHRDRSA